MFAWKCEVVFKEITRDSLSDSSFDDHVSLEPTKSPGDQSFAENKCFSNATLQSHANIPIERLVF